MNKKQSTPAHAEESSSEKVRQFNFRLPLSMTKQVSVLSSIADYPIQDIGEDLVRFILGSKDKNLVKRLNELAELSRQLKYDQLMPPESPKKMERAKGFEPSTFTLAR
jgi:hypothetical protein